MSVVFYKCNFVRDCYVTCACNMTTNNTASRSISYTTLPHSSSCRIETEQRRGGGGSESYVRPVCDRDIQLRAILNMHVGISNASRRLQCVHLFLRNTRKTLANCGKTLLAYNLFVRLHGAAAAAAHYF